MDKYLQWLKQNNIPQVVQDSLLKHVFERSTPIGSVFFNAPAGIIDIDNTYLDLFPNWHDNHLLIIATASTGDGWAISFTQLPATVVIFPMDDQPEQDGIVDPAKMIKIADSLDEFIQLAKEGKLPFDYYDAKEKQTIKPGKE